MENIIEEEIVKMQSEIKGFSGWKDEALFSLVCYKYFFSEGEMSFRDAKSIFTDGRKDGGIDLIGLSQSSSGESSLVIVQGKYYQGNLSNFNDIIDIVKKMQRTYNDFSTGANTTKYSDLLRRTFREKLDEWENRSEVRFVVFHSAKISSSQKADIQKEIEKDETLRDYIIEIYDKDLIDSRIEAAQKEPDCVEESKIFINKADGVIKYGENGLLVNVWASSLRDLFEKFKDRGLFEQNFRYFVQNKKIDDNIEKSLEKKRDKFWFLNNGIIIGCQDFRADGDNVRLSKFSIINGCQTTTLIGKHPGLDKFHDFVLPCKIIKPYEEGGYHEFISEVAESSNSQKPISDRDLKSNRREQLVLQKKLKEGSPYVHFEIKRGAKPQFKNLEDWQKVKNDEYGQYLLSICFQQPGTARSGKKKIFSEDPIYQKIFIHSNPKKEFIVDMLQLVSECDNFLEIKLSEGHFTDVDEESVAKNGRLAILSLLGFIIKIKRNLIDIKKIRNLEEWESSLEKFDLDGKILNFTEDNYQKSLHSLLIKLIKTIKDAYDPSKHKTVTNFLKLDSNYQDAILKTFKSKFMDDEVDWEDFTEKYLSLFV